MKKLAPLACALFACGHDGKSPGFPGLTLASGASPLAPACGKTSSYPGSAVEPMVSINPRDPRHLVGVWQQDRWADGGANGLVAGVTFDGGATWTRSAAHFSSCSGGVYERASDPWVSIAPDGTAHQIALAFNQSNAERAVLASRSTDGGRTWAEPIVLKKRNDADFALDKETITADPYQPGYVYAVWDELTGQTNPTSPLGTGPAWFARSTDGGAHWEPARPIYDPGTDAQTIGNQIVVLPGGTLVNLLSVITQNSSRTPKTAVAVLRSTDKGATWSFAPVAQAEFVGVFDRKSQKAVRSGDVVPAIAVDAASGVLYAVWEDARFSSGARDGIALSRSIDGGLTWSVPPTQVNLAPGAQAFTPAAAVSQAGKLGVTYYDLRNDDPNDGAHLRATAWLAISVDGGRNFREEALATPFDLRTAPFAEGYFLGDYQGLVHAGESFLPFFSMTNAADGGRAEVFFRPAQAPAPAAALAAESARLAGSAQPAAAAPWDARGAVRTVPRTLY